MLWPMVLAAVVVAAEPEQVTFEADDGAHLEGALFEAGKALGVVFAHGAVFDQASWYPLARHLQKAGISSLAFDFRGYGKSRAGKTSDLFRDVLGAVRFLKQRGFRHVALVGGSMGGAAVLEALSHEADPAVVAVALLAPASSTPVKGALKKLYVVSEGDPMRARVEASYEGSSEPKAMHRPAGSAHAQHLFRSEHGQALTQRLTDFLLEVR